MYDWDDLRYFLALHREGSLVDASNRVRADPTTVSRRIGALEKALGSKLFVRGRDGWTLTPTGVRMLPSAEQAEAGAMAVQRGVEQLQEAPEGRVRITTLESIATWFLGEVFDELREAWPGLRVDLICTPKVLDLARGEADIALRVGRPEEQGLLARRVTTVIERPYAHQDWLVRTGVDPRAPVLEGREVLVFVGDRWSSEQVVPVLRTTSVNVLYRACLRGHGVAVLPDVLARRHPELVPLEGPERRRDVWMVMHPDVAQIERVRVVADLIVARLADRSLPVSV